MLLLPFHLVTAACTALAVACVARRPDRLGFWAGVALLVASVPCGLLLGRALFGTDSPYGGSFGRMQLMAWSVFVHWPLYLAGVAFVFRRSRVRLAVATGATSLVIWGVAVDAFFVEPTWLEVTYYELETAKLTEPLRIVVLADLQSDHVGAYEARVLRRAMELEPDLVLLPGDYVHALADEEWREVGGDLNRALREVGLRAPLGIHAVAGNVDPPSWPRIFDGLPGVECYTYTRAVDVGQLKITGLGFWESRDSDLSVAADEGFHIVFGHYPDFALGDIRADLLIAGHTHGGQVRLPWIGPLITLSRVPRAWATGHTELERGRALIVSRGIGLERGFAPRLRFLCRPELAVVDLLPLESGNR